MGFYSVKEVWEDVLGKKVGLSQIYTLIKGGKIPSIKVGERILVRKESLHAWLDEENEKERDEG